MKVLVTGATGFVGFAVAARLVEQGHTVAGLTRSETSALPSGVTRVRGDLTDAPDLDALLADVEGVCHLAALTQARESLREPITYWRTNVGGTLALLDAMLTAGTKRLVVASTCAVYGEAEHQPITETAPELPTNPYATSKLAADQAVSDVAATGALGATTLRPCNVAGAVAGKTDPDETRLIPRMLAVQQDRAPELVINGDGAAIRDFVHVADVAAAFSLALDACEPGTIHTYNIGSGRRTSVLDVLHAVERVTGRPVARRHAPAASEPQELRADGTLITETLGWHPRRSGLDDIVRDAWTALVDE